MALGFNNMNMLGMNNMFGSNIFGGNMLSGLFSGTGSIFGGGNMFGCNMFGGAGSLFTNCNGQMNYNAMAGFGVGMALLNVGGAAFSQIMADKKANSPKTIQADVDSLQTQINKQLGKLGKGVTEDNYATYNVKKEDWYTEGLAEINAKLLSDADLTNCESIVKAYEDLKTELLKPETTEERKKEINDLLATDKTKNKTAEEKIKFHEQAKKDKLALEKKAKSEQANAEAIIDKITDLIEKRDNAQAALDERIFDDADGTKLTRNKKLNVSGIQAGHTDFKKGDIQQLVFLFTKASNDDPKKQEYAQALANLDTTTFLNMANDSQITVREMALEYLKK